MNKINYDIYYRRNESYKKYLEHTVKELETAGVVYVFNEQHVKDIENLIGNKYKIDISKIGMNIRIRKIC